MSSLEETNPELAQKLEDLPSRNSASPADSAVSLVSAPPSHASPLEHPRRPVLEHLYSKEDIRSPGRQQFRLHNHEKRQVKSTANINETHNAGGSRSINQYQILNFIANGRYGKVWLALDTTNGTHVAVKEYSKQDILKANRKKLMQLRRQKKSCTASDLISPEVAIMRRLDHPNLVELIEVLEDEHSDSLYMIIEWCALGPLPADGQLDEEQCRIYFRDMILAVEYLHSLGITHRDIKTDNVLLADGDVLKLADFGVSEILEDLDAQVQSCVGSPAYYAPELTGLAHGGVSPEAAGNFESPRVNGRKTDIWAMGVTLYHMFHGHLPFQTEKLGSLFEEICRSEPSFRTGISPEFKDILSRLMAKGAAERITMAEMRVHPWVTRNASDPLLSSEENTSEMLPITEEELNNAIERAQPMWDPSVDLNEVSSRLQQDYGWRGASGPSSGVPSGTATPSTAQSQRESEMNVDKLVRALNEVVRLNEWGVNTER